LTYGRFSRTVKGMEVPFTTDQEAQLARMAIKSGTNAPHLVRGAALRLLDEEARFVAAVEKGIEAAERGEFIDEEEMDARIERMFKP
jgi:predicted transcriptional regulator